MHSFLALVLFCLLTSATSETTDCAYCADGDPCTADAQQLVPVVLNARPSALLVLYDFPSDDPYIGAIAHSSTYSTMPNISTLCGETLDNDCTPPFAGGSLSPIPASVFATFFHWSSNTIRFAASVELHQALPSKTWTLTIDAPLDDVGYGAPASMYHNTDFTGVLVFGIIKGTKLPGTVKNLMVQCFDTCWIYVGTKRVGVMSATKLLSSGNTIKIDADALAGPLVANGQIYPVRVFYVSRYAIVNIVSVSISSTGVVAANCSNTVLDTTVCIQCTSSSQCAVPANTSPCMLPQCDLATHRCTVALANNGMPCVTADPCAAAGTLGQCSAGSCLPVARKTCDDGDNCTRDGCNQQTGACVHTPIPNCGAAPPSVCECFDAADCGVSTPCMTYTCTPDQRCVLTINTGFSCGDCQSCTDTGACTTECVAETLCSVPTGCDSTLDKCTYGVKPGPCPMPEDGAPGKCGVRDTSHIPECGQCFHEESECGPEKECLAAKCSLETLRCSWSPVPPGTECTTESYRGFCLSGTCTECRSTSDCERKQTECTTATCDPVSHMCQVTNVASGTPCEGTKVCLDGVCVQCLADTNCPSTTPYCVDTTCVECLAATDCPHTDCQVAVCTAQHTCSVTNAPNGTTCATNGNIVCFDGTCVQCIVPENCPAVGECYERLCDSLLHTCSRSGTNNCKNGTRRCYGEEEHRQCAECNVGDDCPERICYERVCDDYVCKLLPLGNGAACQGPTGTPGTCNEGICVECNTVGDCSERVCHDAFCISGSCQYVPVPNNQQCPLDGYTPGLCLSGTCVKCVQDGDCPPIECQTATCTAAHTCQYTNLATGTACAGGANVCLNGACVECVNVTNCPRIECKIATCGIDHLCQQTLAPEGTLCFDGIHYCHTWYCVECITTDQCYKPDCLKRACVNRACMITGTNGGAPCLLPNGDPGICNAGSCIPE
jgi:hypothetical protein